MNKIILAIAVVGLGNFAIAQTTASSNVDLKKTEFQQKRKQKAQEHLAKMQKDLNLNESQIAQIKALQEQRKADREAHFAKREKERQVKIEEMKIRREQMSADMKRILTPAQYDKWEAERKAKMEERKTAMKSRGSKGKGMMKSHADKSISREH